MKKILYILPFLWFSVFGQKQSLMSHDQYYRICSDEQNNDIIGVWHTYANDTAFSAKSYTHTIISGNGSGIFEIDTDTLKISDNTSLSAGDYYLGIQTTDETRTETNYANIIVDNSSNCIYFDIDNTDPSEDGTRTHPYDAYADVSWISGKYYRTKRGNSSTSTISTNSLSNISWGAWGSSGDKPLLNTSSGSNHCFYFGNTNYHDSLFIYDYRCYGNTTNQPLKFDDSTFYCQIHRIETKNGTTNGAIYFDKIDSNDLSYNKIYDLITDSSGYQGLKHASGGDTILNYISLRAGYGSGAGYGLTMAYTKNTYVYGLYIDKRGGPNGDGGSKGIDYNTGWNKMENVFIRGSFWIGLNISSQNWVCCDSNIINDIYIDLNDNTYTSNYGILLSDSTGPDKDGRNRYNTFSRFHIENVFKGIDIAQRSKYNNFNYFLINNASNDAVENDGVNSEFHNITSYNNGGNEFDFNASSDLSNSFYTDISGTNSGSNNYDLDGGDPFNNAAGGDFTLSSDTLGIDLGYTYDIRYYEIQGTPSIGAYEYDGYPPVGDTGIYVAYWPLDNDTNDFSGNEHHMTLINEADFNEADTLGGQSVYIDGIDDYMDAGIIDLPDSFTICMWVKNDSLYNLRVLATNRTTTGGSSPNGFALLLNDLGTANKQIIFNVYNGTQNSAFSPVDIWQDSIWSFIAVSVDNPNGKALIYYNGEKACTDSVIHTNFDDNKKITFGSFVNEDYFYEGYIDDIKIFSSILTEEEITDLYNLPITVKGVLLNDKYYIIRKNGKYYSVNTE